MVGHGARAPTKKGPTPKENKGSSRVEESTKHKTTKERGGRSART